MICSGVSSIHWLLPNPFYYDKTGKKTELLLLHIQQTNISSSRKSVAEICLTVRDEDFERTYYNPVFFVSHQCSIELWLASCCFKKKVDLILVKQHSWYCKICVKFRTYVVVVVISLVLSCLEEG